MHGREGEDRKRVRHMWSVPTRGTTATRTIAGGSSPSPVDSICKDGRKISVGDCALFKPPQDSPPFIGIIRWLTNRENSLQLGVNWLYRPAEVKLGKGILLESAPNEVFYSFHKDEIPAASLLHPCKVAFLPKGIELPSGISAFVCHRVYDIANKCLWWLTDQDYIDERQEEVDQLLHKTRIEMHATVQPGGRSPKPVNGPTSTSTSQLKPGSDNVQSATSFPSQVKGKKRERVDQGSEPIKRERSLKADDGDSGLFKPESILKSELSKITEKGGLVDSEGVERLVQLMQPDRADRKMELISRSMLAGVIAATENFDCLSRFVHLKGLPVLDEWLQDAHKGKIGDGSLKDSDKYVDEFLLVLLRALDKLPVNLHALQMCNIGKSVNHLRSHKNFEIQKKARSLVDTWKKRVEAEMNVIDAKSGSTQAVSWPSRSRLPEASHGGNGNRHPGGSSEVATKTSITQLYASKTGSVKAVQGELTAKSTSLSPGPMKSVLSPASGKDGQPRIVVGSTYDLPSMTAREERSSSSSQSHNNSQSYSSDHAKTTAFSGKEDARSSTAGSMNMNKISGGSSRHRRSVNGFPGPAVSGGQRETGSSRSSSLHRISASEKLSQSGLTCEKALDVPIVEGNSHKLIVKIPNRGRSPAQSASGGSVDDPSIMNSRASSPTLSDKHDQYDGNSKDKTDANQVNTISDVNTESWQSNDFKDVFTASDEGDGSPDAVPEEVRCRTGEEPAKLAEVSKAASSSSGNELKSGKLLEVSFSSINALIERCAKYSEANASMSAGDDVGMNLLASVAAGEMSKFGLISPTDSPQRNTSVGEDSSTGDDTKLKSAQGNNLALEQSRSADGAVADMGQGVISGNSCSRDGLSHLSKHASGDFSGDGKTTSSIHEQTPNGEGNEYRSFKVDLQTSAEPCLEINERSDEHSGAAASLVVSPASAAEKLLDVEESKQVHQKTTTVTITNVDCIQDTKPKGSSSLLTEDKLKEVTSYVNIEKAGKVQSEHLERIDEEHCGGKADEMGARSHGKRKNEHDSSNARTNENQVLPCLVSAVGDQKRESLEASVESKEVITQGSGVVPQKESPTLSADVTSDKDTKLRFDLNEGLVADDGKYAEPINLAGPGCSTSIHLVNHLPFSVTSVSSGLPASITVASAAKGPFLPSDDLLRSKGELGWKGSAATSAFRPAEPRKIMDMALGTTNISLPDATAGKHGRPLLDFDLNVPNEQILDDVNSFSRQSVRETASTSDRTSKHDVAQNDLMGSSHIHGSGGLDLDLNRVDEASDMGQYTTSSNRRLDGFLLPMKLSSASGFPNCEVRRDFDLNNGPVLDEACATEPSSLNHHSKSSMQSHPPVVGLGMSNAEMGTFSSWFTTGNAYPAVTIPSILADRVEQPFPIVATGGPPRMLGPTPMGGTPFTPDIYRGSVLSSSPSVPFPSTPFQYPVYPFGPTFPLPSANFPGGSATFMDASSGGRLSFPIVNSQFLGPSAAVSPSQYPRPYVVNLPDGSNSIGVDNYRKWGRQGLDLNSGPGSVDIEGRDETSSTLASRQLSVAAGSQALAEEQARMYQQMVGGGGALKRKEQPEGGWDSTESFGYKQSSWQ
ncbi:non-specific serine,threonine protein kinase [Sarracenia purpurea var. burkii]